MLQKKKGFTLAELLIVVLIIAILSVVVIVSFDKARKSSRDSKRMSDLASVSSAVRMYQVQNLYYPPNAVSPVAPCYFAYDSNRSGQSGWSSNCISGMVPSFIQVLPTDPGYKSSGTVQAYTYSGYDTTGTISAIGTQPKGFAILHATLENAPSGGVAGSYHSLFTDGTNNYTLCSANDSDYCLKVAP
jgi:prepilin-type N-terminal cleavage/methylation domain-containing protein